MIDEEDPECQGECSWYDVTCLLSGFYNWVLDIFNGIFDFFTLLKLSIVIIFSLVSVFVSSDLLDGIRSLNENKAIRISISVLIGVLIALLLYSFIYSFWFWILLVAGIVYLIFGKPIVNLLGFLR
jgi:hypothetical protein